MRKILAISFCICLLTLQSVQADPLRSPREVREIADEAMRQIEKKDLKKFFGVLAPYFAIPKTELEEFILTYQNKMRLVENRYGKTIRIQFVKDELTADTVYRVIYFQILEKTFIAWRFIFYKPEDEWIVNTVTFDDNKQKIFDFLR